MRTPCGGRRERGLATSPPPQPHCGDSERPGGNIVGWVAPQAINPLRTAGQKPGRIHAEVGRHLQPCTVPGNEKISCNRRGVVRSLNSRWHRNVLNSTLLLSRQCFQGSHPAHMCHLWGTSHQCGQGQMFASASSGRHTPSRSASPGTTSAWNSSHWCAGTRSRSCSRSPSGGNSNSRGGPPGGRGCHSPAGERGED